MSRYYIEHVFPSEKRDERYTPGLYALRRENENTNIIHDFILNCTNVDYLQHHYEANRHLIQLGADLWQKEILSQANDTIQRLKKMSNQGNLLADNPINGRFINIDSGKKKNEKSKIIYTPQTERKYKSVPSSHEYYSYLRIYGLQFGIDLVLVIGASIKLTATTQPNPHITNIVKETKQWANAFKEICHPPFLHFKGAHTTPIDIEEDEED
jgi:hypothetical protein